jgi:AmmeMemoRadiSam system protein B
MRYPAVAGQFYSASESALREEITDCYTSPHGPGRLPEVAESGPRSIMGVVAPHAGYMYSGPVAAHDYLAIAEDGYPETFVILGPNHHGVGSPVAVTTQDFKTPLGVAEVNPELAAEMSRGLITDDPSSHRWEHSIEVQLPFLQFPRPDVTFVPISMLLQDMRTAVEVGKIVGEAIRGRDAVVIASTDFSHYVPHKIAAERDRLAIDKILAMDVKGFWSTVKKHDISMCGYGPVIAMMTAVGQGEAELLKYATSGDMKPMADVVGYGAILVRSKA